MASIMQKDINLKQIGTTRYYVSADGNVYSKKKSGLVLLKQYPDTHGYMRVCLTVNNKQHRKRVHTLVLTAFNGGRPKGFVCRHLDGDKTNNELPNLAWGTQKENIEDQRKHGTMYGGEQHHLVTVPDATVYIARTLFENGYTQKEIAKLLDISKYSVHNYVRGKSRKTAKCQ